MDVAGLIFALPPIIENCIQAASFIKDCLKSEMLLSDYSKNALSTATGVFTTLEAVKAISARYGLNGPEHDYVVGHLEDLFDILSAMVARLRAWDTDLRRGSVRRRTMASVQIAFSKDQFRSRMEKVQVYLGSLGTYVLVIATSREPCWSLEPRSLIPNPRQNEQSPAELVNAVRILMAQKNERNGIVREISLEEVGRDAKLDYFWEDVAFGRNTTQEFQNCIFVIRQAEMTRQNFQDTKRLAALLSDPLHDHSNHGLLRCLGYCASTTKLQLVFKLPSTAAIGVPPRPLRELLANRVQDGGNHSLDNRVKFAIQLAHAVLLLHAAGLIHKNIRPDSVFVVDHLRAFKGDQSLGVPYLLGFNETRSDSTASRRWNYRKLDFYRRAYHHPTILVPNRGEQYGRIHDIYSLGICLLEVAIWKSFFVFEPSRHMWVNDPTVVKLKHEDSDDFLGYTEMRELFIKMAREIVPGIMGTTFAGVVLTCLTGFNNTWPDEDDIGRLFCEEVLDKLKSIQL